MVPQKVCSEFSRAIPYLTLEEKCSTLPVEVCSPEEAKLEVTEVEKWKKWCEQQQQGTLGMIS